MDNHILVIKADIERVHVYSPGFLGIDPIVGRASREANPWRNHLYHALRSPAWLQRRLLASEAVATRCSECTPAGRNCGRSLFPTIPEVMMMSFIFFRVRGPAKEMVGRWAERGWFASTVASIDFDLHSTSETHHTEKLSTWK